MTDKKITPEKRLTFGRIFWPSFLAVFIVSLLGILIFFMVLGGIIGNLGVETPKSTVANTVLHLTLEGEIRENSSSSFNPGMMSVDEKIGLSDLLFGFEKAKSDKKIKGVFLEIKQIDCGVATIKEIRTAINDFEKCGKFVLAYNSGELISQKAYYLSSAANENYGFPTSMMEFIGLGGEMMFFKNTLDKLGIEMQVIRGKNNDFKSAVEPYFRTNMSDSSRLQTERYISCIWEQMRNDIALDRKVSAARLNYIAEEMKIRRASDAVQYKLLDACKYRDEVLEILAKKSGFKSSGELQLSSFEKYAKRKFRENQIIMQASDANIAVVLAEGDIYVEGDGLSSKKVCRYLREIRMDDNIKTVVLRINSPGGSALASDEIWREVKLLNEKKKVIVSMGDVAASGGYYIATPASRIFAEANTITGSIGVFGVIPYTGKLLEDHLGLSFDRVSTNKHAVVSTNRRLSAEELGIVQDEVDLIYQEFLQRVAAGRGMTVEQVNVLARGRVWTGTDAKRIGLVDQLGGLTDAISYATKKAKIKEAKVVYYPKKKEDPFEPLLALLEDQENEEIRIKQTQLPASFIRYYEQVQKIEGFSGIQMRLPYELILK